MGTRSSTQVTLGGKPIITIYRQFDGYLTGHGRDILPLLQRKHVNGYRDPYTEYNGVANFAALLVATLLKGHWTVYPSGVDDLECGGIYVTPHEEHGQEFTYTIAFEADEHEAPIITVSAYGHTYSNMTVAEFAALIERNTVEDVWED